MSRALARFFAVFLAIALVAAGCSGDDDSADGTGADDTEQADGEAAGDDDGAPAEEIDYEALGLWDDGPCDPASAPLVIGLMTIFESPLLSLVDQALALEAAAEAFNARGGANGACIEVHTCDDGGNIDQAVACAREIDEAGVVATVNDQGTAGQAEVSEYMAEAGIPRVASNVTQNDWADENAYPLDTSGTGSVFMMPKGLIDAGVTEIGTVRIDLPEASALVGLLEQLYERDGATFPADAPVPAGTTDFSQFVLGAEDEGAGGILLAVGEQEAVQVVRAAEQLGTEMLIGATLGSFSRSSVAEFGDFADQMVFVWSYPPATADVPVYDVLRADLASTGEEALQPDNLKSSPMRSWIGLYALLRMIRDAGMTEFTREGISAMLEEATDVPMLDIFGGENWTPSENSPGIWTRKGLDRWTIWRWDPEAEYEGSEGNFVLANEVSFSDVMCGSIFGAEGPC
jgi:ABC-type branched-subunit amino acid transport system substrate-binding protein